MRSKHSPPFPLLEDPIELARHHGWRGEVYRDLLAIEQGEMTPQEFDARYLFERAILVLDLTGFTETTIKGGPIASFLQILDAHKTCIPVLRELQASYIRTFADDIVALFSEPGTALDAALEIHVRSQVRRELEIDTPDHARCCIGIGFGNVYEIGPNRAMGDEMNRASKLGEDTARGGETLVTEAVRKHLHSRTDVRFEEQKNDSLIFPFYSVERD